MTKSDPNLKEIAAEFVNIYHLRSPLESAIWLDEHVNESFFKELQPLILNEFDKLGYKLKK